LEELAEGAVKSILRLVGVLVRALVWLFWEFIFETLAWYVGWVLCRVISVGRLPQESINEHERASTLTHLIVSLIGFALMIGLSIVIAQLVGPA